MAHGLRAVPERRTRRPAAAAVRVHARAAAADRCCAAARIEGRIRGCCALLRPSMMLSAIVGGAALVPAGLAYVAKPYAPLWLTALLSHVAAAGFAVAVAASSPLAPHTTSLLLKAPNGRIGLLSRIIFWPYHVALRTKLHVQRRTSSEPLLNQVTVAPQLFIGGWPASAAVLPAAVGAVVDVTCELPRTHELKYLCLPTWDTHAPSAPALQDGVSWVVDQLDAGRGVYIHCAHGHGRSATLLAAVLMALGKADSADAAVTLMRQARPRVRLNKAQRAALLAWVAAFHDDRQQQCADQAGRGSEATGGKARSSLGGGALHKRVSC